jgi:antitoxin component of MazEF toxin-antitoxin module
MPIIRKVHRFGDSRAVTIPKSYFEFIERETGQEIVEVAIEVDQVLTITPILPKKPIPLTKA